jgi:curved DNA-binding protein CbpA
MATDPYLALNLPRTATPAQIKKRYRELARKYHPDRLVHASQRDQQEGSARFSEVAGAYALLSDPVRKQQYDHIFKYGGFDAEPKIERPPASSERSVSSQSMPNRKRKTTGIGYTCTDPLAFIWSQGKIQSTTTVAGIQIPSRVQLARNAGGLRFAFSSGHWMADSDGSRKYTSKTTQFCDGKKYTRSETTIVHPDGRKEFIIEGDDYERRYSTPPKKTRQEENVSRSEESQLPWYMNAWHGLRDSLRMCYSPCAVAPQ